LRDLPKFNNPDMLVGTETGDDAGVYRLRPDLAIVNTVDFFTPIVDDPYVFGQISATNALSDVYAMGGEPKTCMNIVCFPKGKMAIEILGEILKAAPTRSKRAAPWLSAAQHHRRDQIRHGGDRRHPPGQDFSQRGRPGRRCVDSHQAARYRHHHHRAKKRQSVQGKCR
jgi:selenide,water dikinase